MEIERILMVASAGIFVSLGTLHLVWTFFGPQFLPRDPALKAHMEAVSPVLTSRTTMWKAWIGFNASHSLGAMGFGLIYGYLAIAQPAVLFGSWYLRALGIAMLGAFMALGKAYWFRSPLIGISVAFALYLASLAAAQGHWVLH